MTLDRNSNHQGPYSVLFILSWRSTRVVTPSVEWFSLLNKKCWKMLRIYYILVLPVMGLSLGSAGFLVVFSTVGIVLGPISSSLGRVVDISPGMLCEHDRVLCASLSISKKGWSGMFTVDLCEFRVCSLLICVNFVYVHCLGSQMTGCWCVENSWLCWMCWMLNVLGTQNFKICELNLKEHLNCFWIVVW